MNIRTQLTLRYIVISALISILASVFIYVFSADYREKTFYTRLENKATNTAKLLIEVEEIDIDLLHRIERNNPASLPNEKIIIYDYRDSVLFATDPENEIRVDRQLLDRIRLGEEVRYRQGDYEVLGFLFTGHYERFAVIAAATDIYGVVKLRNLRNILIGVFGISVLVISWSGWSFAGRALKPISRVIARVNDISISSLNLRVDEGNGRDEIARLANTFNKMLERLESAFISQKDFISNASHELRNPLTAITGQLEVTLLNRKTPEEYERVILSVLEDIRNLNSLSNRLLVLAQATGGQADGQFRKVRIDELVWQAKDELTRQRPHYAINISLDATIDDESKLTVRGDDQLIRVALVNVIDNACKYSQDHTVVVEVSSRNNQVVLSFTDKGIGIPEGDIPHVLEPFFRGSNTNNAKGYGVGLSMTRQIMRAHQGAITIQSQPEEGTVVTLSFPVHP